MTRLALIIAAVSYLLGSIPFGYLLVRVFRGQDVRQTGSGNIGATNVARTGSKGLAIATLLLDGAKGYGAVFLASLIIASNRSLLFLPHDQDPGPSAGGIWLTFCALAAFCAIVGHMFTVWLKFRGGKGVATSAGAFLALAPRAMLLALALFIIIVAVTRYVSLGSMLAAAAFPMLAWWTNPGERNPIAELFIVACSLLVIWRHEDNIRRLLAGAENRFGK